MKKFLELSSWRTALGNLLPSAHGHQGGSRKAIGSMLIMAFAVVGCDDSSSASAGSNDEPGVESSSSIDRSSSSSKKAKSSSSSVPSCSSVTSSSSVTPQSSSSVTSVSSSSSADVQLSSSEPVEISSSSDGEGMSSSFEQNIESSSSSVEEPPISSETESSSSSSEVNCSALLEGKMGWSWDVPKECRLNPDITYGSMTDERDGKTYKTVKIGDQTWMAENLNFDPGQGGSGDAKYDWSWCYGDVPEHCDVTGRLYTWAAAIDSVKLANDADNPQICGYYSKTCTLPAKVQGICNKGWHLPTRTEWYTLISTVGGQSTACKVLKSQTGWNKNVNGTDAFGFSALPAGSRGDDGRFDAVVVRAYFWSATEEDRSSAYYIDLYYGNENAHLSEENEKYFGFSVRCVKD